ncbi:hypothetical protein Rcae01_02355 [Novipirellula caenicola]|uniref:Uncharacterized protein n=1 Tax=Novipirellula caenicola TaxID=1536901 RepID=A0ABP9VT04_9BACT
MMDFLVRQWRIRRTRKSIVRLKQQAVGEFRYIDSNLRYGFSAAFGSIGDDSR